MPSLDALVGALFVLGRLSGLVLSLPGDSPTTDRILNAFETATPVAALSHDKARLLEALPFPFALPWEALLVWLDTAAFEADPVGCVRAAALALSRNDLDARIAAMAAAREQLLWALPGSRATENVLRAAALKVRALDAVEDADSEY